MFKVTLYIYIYFAYPTVFGFKIGALKIFFISVLNILISSDLQNIYLPT